MISIEQITKSYNGTAALAGISLQIQENEFFGLLGPNGAGKSTLLNILVGYLKSDSGRVTISGHDVSTTMQATRKIIGFVPQELALYDRLSAQDNIEFFGALYGLTKKELSSRSEELLNAVGLWDRRNDKVSSFSGGMKRRLNIIASLMHDPKILLCDEPTVGVDPQSRNAIFEFLQMKHREGTTIIYTTHYMEEAEKLCNRIAIIDYGHLIALGSLDELLSAKDKHTSISITFDEQENIDPAMFNEFGTTVFIDGILTITSASARIQLSEILQRIEAQGIIYRDVRYDRPTLESLFLQLTGRRLRE